MAVTSALDRFRAVLAGALRAIAEDGDAEVAFASDASGQSPGKVARVVSPGPSLEPRLVAEARGAADAVALRLKHHDPQLHLSRAPSSDSDARAVFDAKWKAPGATPDAADLHQVLAYAAITGANHVGLVYPGRRFAYRDLPVPGRDTRVSLVRVKVVGTDAECSDSVARLARFVRRRGGGKRV